MTMSKGHNIAKIGLMTAAASLALAVPVVAAPQAHAEDFPDAVATLAQNNAKKLNGQTGGVALVGSSSFGRWTKAKSGTDAEQAIHDALVEIAKTEAANKNQNSNKNSEAGENANSANEGKTASSKLEDAPIINWGISGSKSCDWVKSEYGYVKAIAKQQPDVVVLYGANRLTQDLTDGSKNKSLVNKAFDETKTFIGKVANACKTPPKFILVSTVKAPAYCMKSKDSHKINLKYMVNGKKYKARAWKRFADYNEKLRALAKSNTFSVQGKNTKLQISYCDLEKDYYWLKDQGTKTEKIRYYTDKAKTKSRSISAIALIKKNPKIECPYFADDYQHPTKEAYTEIWAPNLAETIAKVL